MKSYDGGKTVQPASRVAQCHAKASHKQRNDADGPVAPARESIITLKHLNKRALARIRTCFDYKLIL